MQGLLDLVHESKAQRTLSESNDFPDGIFRVVSQANNSLEFVELNQEESSEVEKQIEQPKSLRDFKTRSNSLLFENKSKKEQIQTRQSETELEDWQFEVDLENRQNKVREEEDRKRAFELEQWKSNLHQQIEESAELFNKDTEQNVFYSKGIAFEPYAPVNSWKEQFQADMEKEIKSLDTEVGSMKEMFSNSMSNLVRLLSATPQSSMEQIQLEDEQTNWDYQSDDDYDLDTDTNYFSCSDSEDDSNVELEQEVSDVASVTRRNKRNTG